MINYRTVKGASSYKDVHPPRNQAKVEFNYRLDVSVCLEAAH